MRLIRQFFWIFFFLFLGEVCSRIFSFLMVIPGSVFAMILLFLAIHYHWLPLEQVKEVGEWLTDNMTIMFIPLGVGLMTQFSLLGQGVWWKLLLIISLSTAVMIAFVGVLLQFWLKNKEKQVKRKRGE